MTTPTPPPDSTFSPVPEMEAAPVVAVPTTQYEAAADREATERAIRAAAPVAADVEAIGALAPDVRQALYALLASLADNKYVLGRRYAEWCTGAPMLESAVAAAAMAQDELGHSRSFYPLLRGFPEATAAVTAEEQGWQTRPTTAMAALDHRFATWPDFVAINFVVDTALTVLLEAATDSSYEPLAQRARKILQEEAPHWVHAHRWVRRLAAASPDSREALRRGIEACWDDALTWYGRDDDSLLRRLVQAGLLASGPDALRQRFVERLSGALEDAGLGEVRSRALPWDRWDPQARRLR